MEDSSFWRGKRVFITGHTGFKGSWICWWLYRSGARITGYSLPSTPHNHLYSQLQLDELVTSHCGDIRDERHLSEKLSAARPEIVIHLAAQSSVQCGITRPIDTLTTNIIGTANLLEAVRRSSSTQACLIVTSDKCYRPEAGNSPHGEQDPLGGIDPYSASKASAEIITAAYRSSFFRNEGNCSIASARSGNAVGGGDWAEHRLVPNSIRALMKSEPIPVYGQHNIRPWQHVLELVAGYLWLLQSQTVNPEKYSGAWNFGPAPARNVSTLDVVNEIIARWGTGSWTRISPHSEPLELENLSISTDKSASLLNWKTCLSFEETIASTVRAYKKLSSVTNQHSLVRQICDQEIDLFLDKASAMNLHLQYASRITAADSKLSSSEPTALPDKFRQA